MNRFSLDEYTEEEVLKNGNEPYGGKRHDEILAYLKKCYDFDDYQLNDISMGIWLAIENQREVNKSEINSLQKEIESLQSQIVELKSELEKEKRVVNFYALGEYKITMLNGNIVEDEVMGNLDRDINPIGHVARQRQKERNLNEKKNM